jgi:cation transport ATPase
VGVSGSVDRHPVRVGSPQWIGVQAAPTIWTTVGVEVDGRHLGSITVADDVRPDLVRDVGRLRSLDVDLVLVSDDTEQRTHHVASLAGIGTVHVTGDSAAVVHDLVAAGRCVATVGLPAPADAHLTVTTDGQSSGTPTIHVDDCSPARVADALSIGRSTATRVRRTRTVTVTLGLLGALVAATGLAGPAVAAITAVAICAVATVVATAA